MKLITIVLVVNTMYHRCSQVYIWHRDEVDLIHVHVFLELHGECLLSIWGCYLLNSCVDDHNLPSWTTQRRINIVNVVSSTCSYIIINCEFLINLFIIQCVNWSNKAYCSFNRDCWCYPVQLRPTGCQCCLSLYHFNFFACSSLQFISVIWMVPCGTVGAPLTDRLHFRTT